MTAALSACAFLPAEDDPLLPPVLNAYERRQLSVISVRRDDLVQTRTISCRSRPLREETYGFQVGGIYIDRVYVSVGDSVKAGDMLAELERKDILAQAEEAKIAVKKQEFALEQARDDSGLRREAFLISDQTGYEVSASAAFDPEYLAGVSGTFNKIYGDYLFRVAYAERMLEIANRKLDMLLSMAEERVVYSAIDGVVSYAIRYSPENRSVAGEKAFTISDASELVYVVTGDDALFFTAGEIYSMKVSKTNIDMLALSPEDIGEPPPRNPVMYFTPGDLTAGLATYGYIIVEINRRDNVLYLPSNAIIQVGDGFAVYREGESGFRELSPVETGVTISGKTEIISGLLEGDEVIFD